MEARAYRFHMRAPLHVGERGIGLEATLEHIPSDTLFSALAVIWSTLPHHAPALAGLEATFAADAPLLLSSAMPCAGSVLLLPRPLLETAPKLPKEDGGGKQFKRVRWVSVSIFRQLAAGLSPQKTGELWEASKRIQSGTVWVSGEEWKLLMETVGEQDDDDLLLWSAQRVPRVTVDRLSNASAIYHEGRTHFAAGCGLWCMAHGDSEWLKRLEDGLAQLAESGLGGRRSRGTGQFHLERLISPPEMTPAVGNLSHAVLLGRLSPKVEQLPLLQQEGAAYQIVNVSGFNGTPGERPLLRRQVRLLSEGSVIGHGGTAPGQLVKVTPLNAPSVGHEIFRYGYGLTTPICLHREGAAS